MTKPDVNLEVRNPVVAGGWKTFSNVHQRAQAPRLDPAFIKTEGANTQTSKAQSSKKAPESVYQNLGGTNVLLH